jgi:hypothetical protein
LEYCLVSSYIPTFLIPVGNWPWTQYQNWIDWYESTQLQHYEKNEKQTRGVSHYGLAIYIKKYLKAKEELWKLKYFTLAQI